MKEIVEDLQVGRDSILLEIASLEQRVPDAISYLAQVHEHLDGKMDAAKQQQGDHTGYPLQQLLSEREQAEGKKKELEVSRKNSILRYATQKQRIESLFNNLVGCLLRGGYLGSLDLAANNLRFVIRDSHEVGGVAFDTLGTVLADLVSMLSGMHGIGHHPGFLVHDSPREGDLAGNIYSEYFHVIFAIHDALGGEDAAPFQYIVTTTTKPPSRAELVRIRLQKLPPDETLFRASLVRPTTAAQEDLLVDQEEGEY
jgi:hypothetical protein